MLKTQNELLRALQKELAAKEKELADQKWILEQFQKSPAWRITYPIRWLVRQVRRLSNAAPTPKSQLLTNDADNSAGILDDGPGIALTSDIKGIFREVYQFTLKTFLSTDARLRMPLTERPVVSVIVVLFNHAELSFACLRSICEHHGADVEVMLIDNASSDETAALLSRVDGATILRNTENLHFLLAVNRAAKECRGEYLLLLNNDAQLRPGAIEATLATIRSKADIGAVGGKIILLDGTLQEAGSIVWKDGSCLGYGRGDDPLSATYNFRRDVDYCSGAFLLTPRALWNRLGGFDEVFKPAYYEETDYCMRLWQNGFRVVYEPAAAVLHYEFASAGSIGQATKLQREHQGIFASRHRAALESHEKSDADHIVRARSRNDGRRILLLDDRVPHHWLGAGFPRARKMLETFVKQGHFVTLYPLAGRDKSWDGVYTDIPREVEIMLGFGRDVLESFLRNRRDYYPTIVISRPHNMQFFQPVLAAHPEWFESTKIIYDAEALFVSREAGLRQLSGNPMSAEEQRKELLLEVNLAAGTDCVTAVSDAELRAFRHHGIENVHVLGHAMEISPTNTSFEERSGLLFVGAIHEEDSPNGDAVLWFLQEILPTIRQEIGSIPVTIAGVNHSERIRALATGDIQIVGQISDLTDLYERHRLFIAPTRYAAGIPYKIHEAAAHGLPVVATLLLAEQLGWTEREIAIGGDSRNFASRCVELYRNSSKWQSLRNAALERVRIECAPDGFERKIQDLLS